MSTDTVPVLPLAGYALLEPQEEKEKTYGGFVVSDDSARKPSVGRVLSIGGDLLTKDGEYIKPEFGIGDLIVYKEYTNQDLSYEGKEYRLVRFDDTIARLREIQ